MLGPNNGSAFADDATVGTVAFGTLPNAVGSDDAYATATLLLGQVSHYLKATGFTFLIPADALIDGIIVEVERSATLALALQDSSVKLVKGGIIGGTDKAALGNWPASDAYASYGSPSDLWGQSWTPADINAATFGVAIAAVAGLLGAGVQIDHVRITVHYTGSNKAASLAGNRRLNAGGMGQSDFIS